MLHAFMQVLVVYISATDSHITQIAAIGGSDGAAWSTYVHPKRNIDVGASRVTGLTYDMQTTIMKLHGNPVNDVLPIRDALAGFLNFLETRPFKPILVGHNIGRFDNIILKNAATNTSVMDALSSAIDYHLDTLPLLKTERPGLRSYGLPKLIKTFLGNAHDAHNAIADVESLRELISNICQNSDLCRHLQRFS